MRLASGHRHTTTAVAATLAIGLAACGSVDRQVPDAVGGQSGGDETVLESPVPEVDLPDESGTDDGVPDDNDLGTDDGEQ